MLSSVSPGHRARCQIPPIAMPSQQNPQAKPWAKMSLPTVWRCDQLRTVPGRSMPAHTEGRQDIHVLLVNDCVESQFGKGTAGVECGKLGAHPADRLHVEFGDERLGAGLVGLGDHVAPRVDDE